jgi:cyclic dehypoxanthinyl futalosine synthase
MPDIRPILDKALSGARLTPADALALLASDDWTAIVSAGHQKRLRMHDPGAVSYTAYRVVNYTNFCDVDCSFCSFKDEIESDRGYTLTLDQIAAKTEEALALGVDTIFLQGGVNPKLPLSYYVDALRMLSGRYQVHVRGFSPIELLRLSQKENLPRPSRHPQGGGPRFRARRGRRDPDRAHARNPIPQEAERSRLVPGDGRVP